MIEETLIREALTLPTQAIAYAVDQQFRAHFPGRAILSGDESEFDLDTFARAGHCTRRQKPGVHLQLETTWEAGRMHQGTAAGWYEVSWEGRSLDVLVMRWQEGYCMTNYYWLAPRRRRLRRSSSLPFASGTARSGARCWFSPAAPGARTRTCTGI